MNYFKSFTKGFQLNYADKQMEKEYITIERQNNIDNTQFSLYFIVFLLLFPGVPALIDQAYWDFGVVALTVVIIFIISCCKIIPRQYVQFLIAIVICSFNYCLFLLSSSSFDSSSKGITFYRGYSSASINVTLLARFTTLKQKILFLMYAFVFRFTLISLLDPNSVQTITIIRHIYVDTFVACASFLDDKKRRVIFQKFYEFREELTKFKELLANYLPQSITIFGGRLQKPLFSNKSFSETFDDSEYGNEARANSNLLSSLGKPQLKTLEIDPRTVRDVGENSFHLNLQNKVECFEDVFEELNRQNVLDNRTISLSASYSSQEEYKSFEVILTKIKWDTEDAVAVILNDITYQENIIRLRISDANKDRIIATVSHELRTPLNGILGILEIAGKRIEDEKTLEYLELCKDNAHLLLNLVNSLLDLHQVRHGKLRTNPDILEVRKVLEGVKKLFVFQCNQKNITLKFQVADNAPKHIYTDENRLKQILINLIGNSLKFTSKGEITVEVEQDPENEEYLQISVSDTGIGIKEEDKDKLFQMYEKIEHGRSVNKNGVGLGLTISNTLAGILSGKKDERVIEVESEVNKGSKFSFNILKNLEASNERDSKCLSKIFNNPESEKSQSLEEMNSQEELEAPKRVGNGELTARNIPKQMESHTFIFQPPSAMFLDMKGTTTKSRYSPTSYLDDPLTNQKSQLIRRNSGLISPRGGKGCLLAVDDNPFNLLVAQNLAQDIGYTLKMTQSGQEAIEVMKCRNKDDPPFKAILMDCQMPLMDGFETTRKLRDMMEKGEIQNVPIIALTANNTGEDIKRCFESGMVDHLSKPLFVHELEKALNGLEK